MSVKSRGNSVSLRGGGSVGKISTGNYDGRRGIQTIMVRKLSNNVWKFSGKPLQQLPVPEENFYDHCYVNALRGEHPPFKGYEFKLRREELDNVNDWFTYRSIHGETQASLIKKFSLAPMDHDLSPEFNFKRWYERVYNNI